MPGRRRRRGEPGQHPFRVRVSARAQQVRLTLSSRDGLVVVVPQGFDQSLIPALLAEESNQRWLARATATLAAREAAATVPAPCRLPDQLELRAVGQVWQVQYEPVAAADSVMLVRGPGPVLTLSGATGSFCACAELLRAWLRGQARSELGRRLAGLADQMGLRYSRLTVRQQKSRWGSCSVRGSINLNLKLLFLPPEVVDYVLAHELCHLVEPNHSPRFWERVDAWLPDYASRRRALREATMYIPGWVDRAMRP